VAQSPRESRPIALTLTYVLGLALVYSALGLFAGMTGTLFGTVRYRSVALPRDGEPLLLIAALAMMDVVHVRLPPAIVERASNVGSTGRLSGAFAMGAMSGLVAAPCSAPVMAAVLTWVASTKSALLGFVYLLVFSLGMCTLLVFVGVSSGTIARLRARRLDGVGQAVLRARQW
jgi:thiol:disulfide interchange protein DsbD